MKSCSSLFLALIVCAVPALANVTVSSPAPGAEVSSPFALTASSVSCSSQPIDTMGYSLDHGKDIAVVNGKSIAAQVTATAGAHVLKVKSWGDAGAVCVTDVAITVVSDPVTVGSITVSAPANGAELSSPFTLSAADATCGNRQVVTMGYSLDASTENGVVKGDSIDAQVTATSGPHVLHVKSWGPDSAACVVDLDITITSSGGASSVIPANAVKVSSVQSLSNWIERHDPGTGADSASSGAMSIVNSPSLSGFARKFTTTYSNYGGELYSDSFGDDAAATNFFYDGWVYLPSPSTDIANIEMDMNQVIANGDTVIYAFQCSGNSGTWEYSENIGTASQGQAHWIPATGTTCNPRNWTANTWHRVQVWYSRDDAGNVTYHSVWFDNVQQQIEKTVFSEFALDWAQILMTNFQVDGVGASGTSTAYLDQLTVYRW